MRDTFGSRVRAVRVALGKKQKWLAEAVGVSQQNISWIENDHKRGEEADTTYAVPIAEALGVEPRWLETGKGPMKASPLTDVGDLSALPASTQEAVHAVLSGLAAGEVDPSLFEDLARVALARRNIKKPAS